MGGDSEMNSIPKGYKKTEVGVIPEEWCVKKLGEVCKILRGGSPRPIEDYLTTSPSGINWIKIGDVSSDSKYITYTEEKIIPEGASYSRNVYPGDFLLSNSMSYGRPYILNIEGCIHDGWLVLQEFFRFFESDFLYYGLSSAIILKQYEMKAAGSSVHNLNKDLVSDVIAVIPPLPEQKAIAEVLSDMDALIEAQKELIAKKRDIKQGAMQELLSGRMRLPGYETKGWKHTDIGDIPDDWDVKKLGEEGVFLTTSSYTRSELREYGDVACLHYGDIHTRFHTWLDCSSTELPMISRDMVKQYPYLKNGDLVIADASEDYEGLGDCVEICNIDSRLCIGGLHTIVYRAKPGLFAPSYIGLLRNLQVVKNQLVSQAVGTKVYSLTNSMIGSILVPVPFLLPEQQAIAEVLSDMEDEIENLEAELKKLNHMKRGMMQELLTGRIRLI